MTRNMKRMGWAAASTAVALTASGLLAPAAFAGEDPSLAPTSGPAFDATAQQLLANDDVQAVTKDTQGRVVVYTTEAEGEAKTFADSKSNVVVKHIDSPFSPKAETDVVAGAGYFSADPSAPTAAGGLCSIGFTGFTPTGDPAVITAGHCNDDGAFTASVLTVPTGDPAGGGAANNDDVSFRAPLGTLGFSQYGGPGNSAGTVGDKASVDIAAIDVTNTALNLKPEITNWSTAASGDLSLSTIAVTSVGKVQAGQVSKSGRTTGYTTGTVLELEGWAKVGDREVYGFPVESTEVMVLEGDSGGAVFQGNTAVGVVSGGDDAGTLLWAADLQAGLERTGGYTVAVEIAAPALVTPANGGEIGVGGTISGTAPAGTTVEIKPASGAAFDALTDAAGNWSFAAPDKLGTYAFSVTAKSGFSRSPSVNATVEVKAAPPVITSPGNGSIIIDQLNEFTGTGLPGATVNLTVETSDDTAAGDDAQAKLAPAAVAADGSAVVRADGTWSIPVDLGIGAYNVSATQARDGQVSAAAVIYFTIAPPAPTIDGIQDGATYSGAAVPTSVSGTGVNGAEIVVVVNQNEVARTTVQNGTWSVLLPTVLGEGAYELGAVQTVQGVSNGTYLNFTVAAVAAPGLGGTPAPGGNGGGLAVTGMGDIAPLTWGALALLLGGIGALGFRSLRRAKS